jgi:citrate lyase subunit beta / citryl-CoA lyase
MRSLLFVPADSERKIAKALGSAADAVILDLEDGVGPDNKLAARAVCAQMLASPEAASSGKKLIVRINAFDTPLAVDDLAAVARHAPFAIMLPKSGGAADLIRLGHILDGLEARDGVAPGSIRIVPVATETASAVLNLAHSHPVPRLYGMMWGAEDLTADVGGIASRRPDASYAGPALMARNLCLFGAGAAGVAPIDAVYVNFRDEAGLRAEAEEAKRDGFVAKACIHPDQVGPINEVFSPSETEIDHANQIIAAFAAAPGAGAVALNGRMLDRPHLRAAERVLARAG